MAAVLAGKVAIVTGGASGIGAATVRRFAEEGARIIIADVQDGAGEALAREIGALFAHHDVANEASWERLMALVWARHSRLDVVMNNAGIVCGKGIEEIDFAAWSRVIGINLTGVMLGCRFGITAMRKNPGGSSGSLINVASTAGFMAIPDVAYSASKFGVRGITRSVAVHCARAGLNIRCNAIAPGATDTPILGPALQTDPKFREIADRMAPMGRLGRPEEIAAMAVFLASDESRFSTGADFVADGGLLAAHPGM